MRTASARRDRRRLTAGTAGAVLGAAVLAGGCDELTAKRKTGERREAATAGQMVASPSREYLLPAEPEGAKPVEAWAGAAAVGDRVVISGRVGGSEEPIARDRAVMMIVGPGVPACSDKPGNTCATPWDYCCERREDVAAHAALVEVTGPDGRPLAVNLSAAGGIAPGVEVVVVGTVRRVGTGEEPSLVVAATGVFVRQRQRGQDGPG